MAGLTVALSTCISPNFFELYKLILLNKLTEYWLRGGRGSTKSSFISIILILAIIKEPDANVIVFRRFDNEVRDSVFGQLKWAINKLQVGHLFKFYVSPFKIIYEPTGQMIIFKGADNPKKIKSINLGTGYIKYAWFEECDQFGGMGEIRNILQSIFRGTNKKQIAFYSYNPPKSARSWVNAETRVFKQGRKVHFSDYRDVPPEWLGETFIENALHLKDINEEAYNHEYLGLETGTGLEVFSNVTLRPISDKEMECFDNISQGLDFGYTSDPLCFEQMHIDNTRKKIYIFFEISGVGIKNSKFASMLTEDQRTTLTLADKASPKDIDELREDYNLNIIGADKPPGSRDYGTKWLQDLEEIIIDPIRCPLAAQEFVNYALQVTRYGEVISKYPDKADHSIDCTRYSCSLSIIQARVEKRKNKWKVRNIPTVSRWGK